jgi:hypothetical protein
MKRSPQGVLQADRTSGCPVHTIETNTELGKTNKAGPPAQPRQDSGQFAAIDQQIIGPLDLGLQPEILQL